MYRVELKAKSSRASTKVFAPFLMYRVELKGEQNLAAGVSEV